MNITRPMTFGELADRAATMVVRRWLQLAIIAMVWILPGLAVGVFAGGRNGSALGFFLDGALGFITLPAAVSLLAGAETSLGAAFRWGASRAFLALRCTILSGLTYGIATALLNRAAQSAAYVASMGGSAIVLLLGTAFVAPLFLIAGVMTADALLRTGHATVSFGVAWTRIVRGDLRRCWIMGAIVSIAMLIGSTLLGAAIGFVLGSTGQLTMIPFVVLLVNLPLVSIVQLSFCIALDADLRLRFAADDLEALVDEPREAGVQSAGRTIASPIDTLPGVSTSQ